MDRAHWPEMKQRFAYIFRTKTREEWAAVFGELDACATPVLSPAVAPRHPHVSERRTFVEIAEVVQPAPAPRFDRTQGQATAGGDLTRDEAEALPGSRGPGGAG